jgi:hypothetical protein
MGNTIRKPLIKEFNYYVKHQEELVEKYNGKYLVIKGDSVKAFDNIQEAMEWGSKNYELGTFLVQKCGAGEENYTQHFFSRVVFA